MYIVTTREGAEVKVCDCHAYLVKDRSWRLNLKGYAVTSARKNDFDSGLLSRPGHVRMHRLIMSATRGVEVDHRDGDRLNNQCSNLRLATHSQNQHNAQVRKDNTSGYKGVYRRKGTSKWVAEIKFRNRVHYLGIFQTAEEAAEAYNKAAIEYHGEFARLNTVP